MSWRLHLIRIKYVLTQSCPVIPSLLTSMSKVKLRKIKYSQNTAFEWICVKTMAYNYKQIVNFFNFCMNFLS